MVVETASGVIRWKLVQDNGMATAIDHTNPQPGNTGRQIVLSKTLLIVAADEQSREDILNECSHSTQICISRVFAARRHGHWRFAKTALGIP